MVFAFLCHSMSSTPCRLLYNVVYGEDMQTAVKQSVPVDGLRKIRKEQLLEVACRVQAEKGFRHEAKDKVPKGSIVKDETTPTIESLPNYERGYFRLHENDPFNSIKTVLWMVCENAAFVLILEQDENRILGELVLTTITRLARDYAMVYEQKSAEILLKAEKISVILQVLLQNGQLMFMNHRLIKQFEKQIETILK